MILNHKKYICYTWCLRKYIAALSNRCIHKSCILHLRKPSSAQKITNYFPDTSKMTVSGISQTQKAVCYGNTNFYGIEGDEGVIYPDELPKRQKLIQDSMKNLLPKPKSEFKTASFGAVRLDSENRPTYYARYSTGKGLPKSSDSFEKEENESLENVRPSKSNDEFVTNQISEEVDNTTGNNVSPIEQSPSFFLSDVEKNYSVNCTFPETNQHNQADLSEKNNFIDSFYSPTLKDTENTVKNVHETNMDFSTESDFNNTFHDKYQQGNIQSAEKTTNFIDEQYFPDVIVKDSPEESSQKSYNYIDEQYFSDVDLINSSTKNNISNSDVYGNNNDLNLKSNNNITANADLTQKSSEVQTMQIPDNENKKFSFNNLQLLKNNDVNNISEIDIHKSNSSIPDSISIGMDTNREYSPSFEKRNQSKKSLKHTNRTSAIGTESHSSTSTSEVQTETAYDFVKQLRKREPMPDEVKRGISAKKEKKVDSKGFRILKHQVPSLMYFTRDEMLELLKKNILYIDEDIVILNKPYNLVIHESSSTKNSACLSTYLSDFAQLIGEKIQSPELFTIHRLDKETTGCLLLARNLETAQRMKSLFAQRKIIKTYWIVTTKVPDPMEGVIDIPISEGKIGDRTRMVLHPDLPSDIAYRNHSKCGKRAVTYYSVIATSGNAALVEVKPETGIKHQIRVHFGFGVSCPILGDHKYSYLDKFVPQKLSSDLLQRLRVRQSKVRHIPLHIHSKHVLIPQYANGRNLFVTAPLPHHMSENLRFLKFKKK